MDALDRIKRISPSIRPGPWSADDFGRAKVEGYRRWNETREVFEIAYTLFGDPVAKLEPTFELSAGEMNTIAAIEVPRGGGNCPYRALYSFVRWERCPLT